MLARLLGEKSKKRNRGTDQQLAEVLFQLNQRRIGLYMPFLEGKIAALRIRIEDKGRGRG
jgi:hypothetical protein